MSLRDARDNENLASLVSDGSWRRWSEQRPGDIGAFEPVTQSGPDVDPYPGLLPPTVGEHVEQSVLAFDIPDREPP